MVIRKCLLIAATCVILPFTAACSSDGEPTDPTSTSSSSSTSTSQTSSKTTSSSSSTDATSENSSENSTSVTRKPQQQSQNKPTTTSSGPVGYTEAPGQAEPSVMNKTIQSCGDPSIHEVGTTFFTDGTSGWTQQCANQMAAQQPAPAPEPEPEPAPEPVPAPAPAPAPTQQQENYVHPGAFCSGGGTGVSKNGVPMTCAPSSDGRGHWQSM